jgi:cytochrome c-type biogenesis protein
MEELLTSLTEALYGSFTLALVASVAWGVASILLSPCHLSSIPLIIGFLTAKEEKKTGRAVLLSLVFALGILITIAIIGIVTGMMGRIMGDLGSYGKYGTALVLLAVGLTLMDILKLPDTGIRLEAPISRPPFLSALVLGLLFGFALGPCTFAFMAPVLGLVFQISTENPIAAGGLLLAFGLGHCGIIVIAGGLAARVQVYLNWADRSNTISWIKRGAGFLVILGGVYTLVAP